MRNVKGKVTITISIGLAALALSMIMFMQFKTVEKTDIMAIETMRETELRTELSSWTNLYNETEAKLAESRVRINEYKTQLATTKDSSKILDEEVKEAEKYLGYTDMKGEGIIITLEDNDKINIEPYDILQLINELKLAGAEAISINNERVVNTTDIALVNNRIILVNGRRISGPYVIKAIGDRKYLESAITIRGGYIDEINAAEKTVSYSIENEIIVQKYEGIMELNYSEVKKGE